MKTYVFINDKGGVTKTTTTGNFGVWLSQQGYKTLLVDFDDQGDLSRIILGDRPPLYREAKRYVPSLYTLLRGGNSIDEVIMQAPRYENLSIIPANSDLAELVSGQLSGKPYFFSRQLQELNSDQFDYVLIDTGKGFNSLSVNALLASDYVIIMVAAGGILEIDAIERMTRNVELMKQDLRTENPEIASVLLTRVNNYLVAQDVIDIVQEKYPTLKMVNYIPEAEDVKQALGRLISIFEYKPSSRAAEAYEALGKELFEV